MTHHFAMTSSLLIKNFKIDKFGVFSSDIDFKTKMDIFRDYISLIINQCHLQATEGSVRQPRSASKRSALVVNNSKQINYQIYSKICYSKSTALKPPYQPLEASLSNSSKFVKWCENMHIIFFIAIHYNTFKISNKKSCSFDVLITMTIYCSVVQ